MDCKPIKTNGHHSTEDKNGNESLAIENEDPEKVKTSTQINGHPALNSPVRKEVQIPTRKTGKGLFHLDHLH